MRLQKPFVSRSGFPKWPHFEPFILGFTPKTPTLAEGLEKAQHIWHGGRGSLPCPNSQPTTSQLATNQPASQPASQPANQPASRPAGRPANQLTYQPTNPTGQPVNPGPTNWSTPRRTNPPPSPGAQCCQDKGLLWQDEASGARER